MYQEMAETKCNMDFLENSQIQCLMYPDDVLFKSQSTRGLCGSSVQVLTFKVTSRSLKAKSNSMAELAIYDFRLVSNSNQGSITNGFLSIEG